MVVGEVHIGGGTGLFMTDSFADPTTCALASGTPGWMPDPVLRLMVL